MSIFKQLRWTNGLAILATLAAVNVFSSSAAADGPLPVIAANASADDGNVPANAIDGNLTTRWSCLGVGCWIRLDLGSTKSVSGANIAWFVGDTRQNNFVITTSEDGTNYVSAFSGQSSGTTTAFESYTFAARNARYVQITVNGNTSNTWASVSEIQVVGAELTGPYLGTPFAIPGKIEAEDFDNGGEGVAYHDTTPGNYFGQYRNTDVDTATSSDGGYRVGYVFPGEWISYTVNVATTGSYTFQIRSATTSPDSVIYLKVGQTDVSGPISLPNTGSWTAYTTTAKTGIQLTAGQHVISIYNHTGNVDFNWFNFVREAADPTLQPVSWWENRFLGVWAASDTEGTERSLSKDSWQFYNLAYIIDGNVKMFEATGKTQYLDRALKYTFNMIDTAVLSSQISTSQYKDSYKGWGAYTHPDGNSGGKEYPLYESYCWRYVTQMLKAMKNNAAVYGNATYRAKYDQALAFTKQHMFNKWKARGANANIYRVNTHMASHWALISLNLWLLTDNATERAVYKEVVDNINLDLPNYSSSLRGQMQVGTVSPGAMFWNHNWGYFTRPGQDVAHGNAVITYVIEARNAGVEWTDADMQAFTKTLLNVIWIPTSTGYRYSYYVDGTNNGSTAGNGWFNDGWAALGRFNTTIQKRLETHNVGQGVQLFAHGALNVKLLNGR